MIFNVFLNCRGFAETNGKIRLNDELEELWRQAVVKLSENP
jgi:hypothetical protein